MIGPSTGSSARVRAASVLGCRDGASAFEIRAAFRAAVRAARPDTGGADGAWLADIQAARDLLLTGAEPDRRRSDRAPGEAARGGLPTGYLPLRRSTWTTGEPRAPQVDVRL